jgi:hypothetical protein
MIRAALHNPTDVPQKPDFRKVNPLYTEHQLVSRVKYDQLVNPQLVEMLQEERLLAMKERNRKFLNKTNSQGTTPSHSSLKDDEETNKDGSDLAPDVNNNKSNHLYQILEKNPSLDYFLA